MKKRLRIISAVCALAMCACGTQSDPDAGGSAAEEAEGEEVTVFPRNEEALVGDTMPFFDNGKMNIFYLADLRDGTGGRVAIGTLLSAAAELLPTAIARLRKDRPKLVVKIVEGTNDVLIPALRAGELDMVVGRLSELRDRLNVVQEVLMDDIACVVARRGHPLADRRDLGLADLIGWEWILPPQETSLRRQIDIAFREEGLEPPVHAVDSVSLLTNRALLVDADYLGVFPAQVARREAAAGAITILPVTLRATAIPIGITTRTNARLSPAAELLAETLRRTAVDLTA